MFSNVTCYKDIKRGICGVKGKPKHQATRVEIVLKLKISTKNIISQSILLPLHLNLSKKNFTGNQN